MTVSLCIELLLYKYICLCVYVWSVSKQELDINRLNTLRADVFYMQGKKERKMGE